MNTVHSGVLFTYQHNKYDSNVVPDKSKPRCSDNQEHLIDKDSCLLKYQENSLACDDKLDKSSPEGHTFHI